MSMYPQPRLSNGFLNTIFNSSNFQDKSTIEFIPTTGGSTTGSLSVGGRIDATEIVSTGDVNADILTANTITLNNDNVGLGNGSVVSSTNGVALGHDSNVAGNGSVAIGYNSTTSTYTNAVALGSGSTVSRNNEVVLGTSNSDYRLAGILGSGSNFMRRGTNVTYTSTFNYIDWNTSVYGNTSSSPSYLQYSGGANRWFENISGRPLVLQISVQTRGTSASAYNIVQILEYNNTNSFVSHFARSYNNTQYGSLCTIIVLQPNYKFKTSNFFTVQQSFVSSATCINILVLN